MTNTSRPSANVDVQPTVVVLLKELVGMDGAWTTGVTDLQVLLTGMAMPVSAGTIWQRLETVVPGIL